MREALDVVTEQERFHRQELKELLVYGGVAFLYLLALTLTILFSGDDYLIPLIVMLVVSVLFVWGTIYLFTTLFPYAHSRVKFFGAAQKGLRKREQVVYESLGKEGEVTKEGIEARLLKASFYENGKTFERDYYVLGSFPELEKGTALTIESFSSVVLAYEVAA